MSTDDFAHDLRARLGEAAEAVTGSGVTMAGVESRLAERRSGRRRRQGALALAAAAAVVLGGVGLAAAVGGDGGGGGAERTGFAAEGDPSSTEAPTTEPGPTEPCFETTTTTIPPSTSTEQPTTLSVPPPPDEDLVAPDEGSGAPSTIVPARPCPPETDGPTTTATTMEAPTDTDVPASSTTAPPEPSSPPTTEPPTATTQPAGWPGAACEPGSHADCIDPEGDGTYVWLIGGADCMASPVGGPMCADLDGDGHAGYPDQG